ncbi:MAG: hypothetical protein NTW04_06380 [Elusimicrobia bacterium]|nr:hypothetical protein [Elusimicrobiota bacterium]
MENKMKLLSKIRHSLTHSLIVSLPLIGLFVSSVFSQPKEYGHTDIIPEQRSCGYIPNGIELTIVTDKSMGWDCSQIFMEDITSILKEHYNNVVIRTPNNEIIIAYVDELGKISSDEANRAWPIYKNEIIWRATESKNKNIVIKLNVGYCYEETKEKCISDFKKSHRGELIKYSKTYGDPIKMVAYDEKKCRGAIYYLSSD